MTLVSIHRELAYLLVRSIIKQLTAVVCHSALQTIVVIHRIVCIVHSKIKSEAGRITGKNIVQPAVLQLVVVTVLEVSVYINRPFTVVRHSTVVTYTQLIILVYLITVFGIDVMPPALRVNFLCLRDVIYLPVIIVFGSRDDLPFVIRKFTLPL